MLSAFFNFEQVNYLIYVSIRIKTFLNQIFSSRLFLCIKDHIFLDFFYIFFFRLLNYMLKRMVEILMRLWIPSLISI